MNYKTPSAIKNLSNSQLSEAINSLQNITWEDDAILRKLALEIHGKNDVLTMLLLAVPLAIEANSRIIKIITPSFEEIETASRVHIRAGEHNKEEVAYWKGFEVGFECGADWLIKRRQNDKSKNRK